MSVVEMVIAAVKEVLLSLTPNRSLYEGMMKYDFKTENPRQSLMQVAFSSLANAPLFVILFLIWLNPLGSFFSLSNVMAQVFGEDSSFRFFLLSGQVSDMGTVLALFFFLEWIFRKEYLFIAVVFYFLSQAQLHLHLALSAVIGVYLSRACYLWWFRIELESLTRKIWTWVTSLQLLVVVAVAIGSLIALDQYQQGHFFAGSLSQNRFAFLFSVVLFFHFFTFIVMSLWGHFFLKKKTDPADLPVYFSTTTWILRFKMSFLLQKKLKQVTAETLKHHTGSVARLQEMKDQSPGLRFEALAETLNKELVYLQTAASRLTVD